MKGKALLLGLCLGVFSAASVLATPTHVTVRVKTKGAKFLGTSMGGALVTIKDVMTGELLAKGYTAGSTGDTDRIMKPAERRNRRLSDEKSAKFTATLDLDDPRLIEVSAYGPLANLQAANRVAATQWIVPGKHLTGGDAWLMELPGFVVDVQAPPTHIKLSGLPQTVSIAANITMMWGCALTPGGVWNADLIEIKALLKKEGKQIATFSLQYAGAASQFSGTWTAQEAGIYEAVVYAYDPANGNTGVDKVTFIVEP